MTRIRKGAAVKNTRWNANWIWADVTTLLLILLTLALAGAQFYARSCTDSTSSYDLSAGWVTEDGRHYALSDLPEGAVTVTHTLADMHLTDKSLCLKSSDTFIEVTVDRRKTYYYAPQQPKIIGRSYGNYIHMIPLPPQAEQITMTLTPVYAGDVPDIRSAVIETQASFIIGLYRQGLPEFFACLVMAAFGVLMILLEITAGSTLTGRAMGFLPLGSFSLLISIWTVNDTYLLQSLTGRPEIVKFICYICMMLIAYPPVSFTACAAKRRDTPLLPILAGLTVLNIAATLTLAALGIADPHTMLICSHLIILAAMCMTVFLMVQAARSHAIERRNLHAFIFGMSAALAGVGIDLLRFWLVRNSAYGVSPFTRVGVLIFLITEGTLLLHEQSRLLMEQGNAEMMKKLAYSDALTALPNRAAYYAREEAVQQTAQRCTVVMLDVNCLKTVNDEYGHTAGDQHIIAAADAIRGSLSALGTCYRIGGDEFAAILDTDDTRAAEQALAALEAAEKAYNQKTNPPVPLQIAYGFAVYSPQEMQLETAVNLADSRMYEMKRVMKARS